MPFAEGHFFLPSRGVDSRRPTFGSGLNKYFGIPLTEGSLYYKLCLEILEFIFKRRISVKKFIVIILGVMLFVSGFAYAKGFEVTKKAGDYSVSVMNDKNPFAAGENNMKITIKDASGKFVSDAKVKVECSMPPMPGMPAMNHKASAVLAGSTYSAKVNLSPGPWTISVKITRGGKTDTARFSVDAQ